MQHAPGLVSGLVTQYFGEALRIVFPFALHCNPHHLVCAGASAGDAFKSKAHRMDVQCGWQFNFFLNFALGRNTQQQVFRGLLANGAGAAHAIAIVGLLQRLADFRHI